MLTKVLTASLLGMKTDLVTVETDLQSGLPAVHMVGLADTTIKEARERIRAAILNSGYEFPKRRLAINLSPAGMPKEGTHFDLPVAMGILLLKEDREIAAEGTAYIGELSLDGRVKHVRGALPLAIGLRERGIRRLVLPAGNLEEVSLLQDMELFPVDSLQTCMEFTIGKKEIAPCYGKKPVPEKPCMKEDFAEVAGQEAVKRAIVTAAAGKHGILMVGSPGSGKTMMAQRIPGIMPAMSYEEQVETTKIYSAAGLLSEEMPFVSARPFRSPHHSISKAALIGGGRRPRPGELSLAHNGILFLDELGQFDLSAVEMLREPIEAEEVVLNRTWGSVCFPCSTMLVAAANPCRCGYFGDGKHICTCSRRQLDSYFARFSGPVLDRIDLHVRVFPVPYKDMRKGSGNLSSLEMRQQVETAALIQADRYRKTKIRFNGRLTPDEIRTYCIMTGEAEAFLLQACERLDLNMRTYYKMIKAARTIADLGEQEKIDVMHIAEALQYRMLDPFYRRAEHGK